MESAEIARRFLAYFKQQGHTIVPSASLVADDPTVLFVIAGMQPFKPYLLGQRTPPYKRAADVQVRLETHSGHVATPVTSAARMPSRDGTRSEEHTSEL